MNEQEETNSIDIDELLERNETVLDKRTQRSLEYEQNMRRIKSGASDAEIPNTGEDRLLHKLREVHGNARYDFPVELSRGLDLPKFLRELVTHNDRP